MNSATIVSKVWSFCTTLRDDGVGYGDYLEQLTYLIFLKMAHEYAGPPYRRDVGPADAATTSLASSGHPASLRPSREAHYGVAARVLQKRRSPA